MKIIQFFILLLFVPSVLQAQFNVKFDINEEIRLDKDSIYLAGDFNDWDYSANKDYRLKPIGSNKKSITLNLKAGTYQYCFYRGSEDKKEASFYGYEQNDIGGWSRSVTITKDTLIQNNIRAWKDHMPRLEVLTITQSVLNEVKKINLSDMNVWFFKKGHDSLYAEPNLNTDSWEKLKPADIKESFADSNGRFEGWFRTKIKIDSSLLNNHINFFTLGWAAMDLYMDGKLIHRYGNTGSDGTPFKENLVNHKRPIVLSVLPGAEHVLAIHYVDELSALPKSAFKGSSTLGFMNETENAIWDKHITEEPIYTTLRIVVGIFLSLLFWLLAFLNPKEKSFKIIAAYSTMLAIFSVGRFMIHNPFASYDSLIISKFLMQFISVFFEAISILLFVIVFNRKITKTLNIIFLSFIVYNLSALFYQSNEVIDILIVLFTLATILYYIISSWKSLKVTHWAIIIGFLLMIIWVIFIALLIGSNQERDIITESILVTALFLSFPISLLVYVALRFKEIIIEVRQNADKLLLVTEEKKELLESQNIILEKQVSERTRDLNLSLENLKSTQAQLIQSEKMASLGELTAGIAHEIQNPLNFVNNFSEVSEELIDEVLGERLKVKGERDENLEEEILGDIKENLSKIYHHGNRASSIVKGMLEHSRTSSGENELTDINALADEYLRLSYHGIRAKDKNGSTPRFNAEMVTDFDPKLPKIEVIPQDIGRVLLNLINNSFQAVDEQAQKRIEGYKPTVSLKTEHKADGSMLIAIKDNGPGIPDSIKDKIFQPFFTTKPSGQGTGLGLSLAYDIVKAHGGDLKVDSVVGQGSEFIMEIPIKTL